jgi:hypothetical protein
MRPLLTILAVLAVVMGIATSSIRPVYARDGDSACDRGSHSSLCGVVQF